MARKAREQDAQPGTPLWMKDHGEWRRIIVQGTAESPKGIKVIFQDENGQEGRRLLDALYRSPA